MKINEYLNNIISKVIQILRNPKNLCIVLGMLLIGSWWFFLSRPQPKPEVITKIERYTDTIIQEKPVPYTVYKDREIIKEVPVEKVITKDSLVYVFLEREIKEYRDTNYYAKISGIDPVLEHIETYNHTVEITKEITKYKRPLVSFGVGVSAGYSPIFKNVDIIAGVNITIPLYSIYTR